MRATALSPAGRQPVRIATNMVVGLQAQAKKVDHFRMVTEMVKSLTARATRADVLTIVAAVAGGTAWIAASVYELNGSTAALATLSASALAAVASITAIYWKKGGEL